MEDHAKNQYLAGICVNIISISYGAFNGWPSASFVELQSSSSPLESGPITNIEAGWIVSMLSVGGSLGTILFSWAADKIGRKRCLILIALPALLGWWIIPLSKNPLHLAASRFLGGFSGGGSFAVIPVYTTEISEDRVRGKLGTLLVLSCNIGILFAFILGNYFSYDIAAWILSALPLTFLITFIFLPESPQYFINKNNIKEAEKSLCYFRNCKFSGKEIPQTVKIDLEKLMESNTLTNPNSKDISISLKDFVEPKARKAFIIGIALMAINQFCGCFAMLNYTATIFKESGSNLTPNMSAIIVGVIQLLGSYMSTILVERAGRKVLLTISSIGTGIGLLCLGTFMYLTKLGFDIKSFSWIPVASFSFTIFIACWGVLTLPFVVVSEIMPPKIRNAGSMICMLTLWLFSFFLLKYLTVLSELFGMYGIMFVFASCCFVGAIFIVLFVPETKGKSIEKILANL
ncbi:facilitated trehalose transporter Tret1-like [Lucilia sericata]|uniref:facilitated trehalose transporter Tret1-like n=1 Tax=Lucilia sericata TaxID=13632 RepID=UPI0018A832F4|nr:facilitated trehalose transporter Tret1-like [Lucilia sericata]